MTTAVLADDALQELCERGQELLMRTRYLEAEATLAEAERAALAANDWDTLARLYMPLQESRRQRRQRCGEGDVRLDLLSLMPGDEIDPEQVLLEHPHGQLLVAGWANVSPAARVRELAAERGLYLETFLAAVYPISDGGASFESQRMVVVVPLADTALPDATPRTADALRSLLGPHCLTFSQTDLPTGVRKGDSRTFAEVMKLWERLHSPFLAAADAEADPIARVNGYRSTIAVDYACELAHQKLSGVAAELGRRSRG